MTARTIYMAAPLAVRDTEQYETFYFHLAHLFVGAEILEARELCPTPRAWFAGWPAVLERIDILIFICNNDRAVGAGTWREVCETRKAGKDVFMARSNEDGQLELVPFGDLRYTIQPANKRNYAVMTDKSVEVVSAR